MIEAAKKTEVASIVDSSGNTAQRIARTPCCELA